MPYSRPWPPKMMLPPWHKPCLMVDWFLAAYDRKLSGRTWQSHFQWHTFSSLPSSLSLGLQSRACLASSKNLLQRERERNSQYHSHLSWSTGTVHNHNTRSMQGMFGASVSELYLLIKLLINIEDNRSMCDHKRKYTCIHRNCESGLAIIYKHAASLAGQPTSAQRGKGLVNELTDVCSRVLLAAHQSGCRFLSHDQLPRNHGEVL